MARKATSGLVWRKYLDSSAIMKGLTFSDYPLVLDEYLACVFFCCSLEKPKVADLPLIQYDMYLI